MKSKRAIRVTFSLLLVLLCLAYLSSESATASTSITLIHSTNTEIVVSWTPVTGALSYEIEVDGSIVNNNLSNSFHHKNLQPNTQHTYRMRVITAAGLGPWSELLSASTLNEAPLGSVNLNAHATNSTVTLVWTPLPNAHVYDVEMNGIMLHSGSVPYCALSGLTPGTSYAFRVQPRNSAGVGQWSPPLNVTTRLLGTPQNLLAITTENSITLTWDEVHNANGYQVEMDGQVVTTAEPSYTHLGLTPETKHTYRVKAANPSGEGEWAETLTLFTLPIKPSSPSNVTAVASRDTISLTWRSIPGALGYDIELNGIMVENDDSSFYLHEELLPYTKHIYRVRSRTATMHSDWSEPVEIFTLPDAPKVPQSISFLTSSTAVEISWAAVPGALGYDIELNGEVISIGSIPSFIIYKNSTVSSEYTYRLRTRNTLGSSEWSRLMLNNAILARCHKGSELDLGLTASEVVDFSKYILCVTYRPEVLEVVDLSTLTTEIELTTGRIPGTDITVTEFTPGRIVFAVDKAIDPGQSWTGIINSIKFKAKVTGGTTLTYTVFCEAEE